MALKTHPNFDRDIVETLLFDEQSNAEFRLHLELSFGRMTVRVGWTDQLADCKLTAEWADAANDYVTPKQWRERLNTVRATDRLSVRNCNQLVAAIIALRKSILTETRP